MKRFKMIIIDIIPYILVYITSCLTTLSHELGHSIVAYFFDIKNNPFDLHYSTKIFMFGISENVDYDKVSKLIQYKAILISAAGLIVNFIFAVSIIILLIFFYRNLNKFLCYVLYLFLFWNVNEFFNYFIIRNIFLRGDVANIVTYGIPHICVLVFGIGFSLILVYFLFLKAKKNLFKVFNLSQNKCVKFTKIIVLSFGICQVLTLCNAIFYYS